MASKNSGLSDCPYCSKCYTCRKRITALKVTVSGVANNCDQYYCAGCTDVNGTYTVPVTYNNALCFFTFDPVKLNGGGTYGLYDNPPMNWIVKLEPGLVSASEGMLISLVLRSYVNGSGHSSSLYAMTATTCEEYLAGCDYVFVGGGLGVCMAWGNSYLHVEPLWIGK